MPYRAIDPADAVDLGLDLGAPLVETGKTLASMRGELVVRLAGRGDLDDEIYNNAINDAYEDIYSSVEFNEADTSFSFELTAGNPLYYVGRQIRVVDHLSIEENDLPSGGRPLDKIDLDTYRGLRELEGDPRLFFRHGGVVVFWPTPMTTGQTVVLDGRLRPQPLTEDTHSPILPLEWHQGLVLAARYKMYSTLQEWQAAQLAENEYVRWVRRRDDSMQEESETRIHQSAVPRSKQMTQRHDVYPRR